MSMLYLWHPSVSRDGTVVDLILTRGDSDQVGGGSDRFVTALANALDIGAVPQKWSIKPYRCNYYSEYWEEDGWDSRWDFVWRATIHFKVQVAVRPLKLGYLGLDDIDDYSPLVESYKFGPYACLAAGMFASEEKAREVARRIFDDKEVAAARKAASAPDPVLQTVRVDAREFHLRAAIGTGEASFFEGGYPDLVVSYLRASGAEIHVEA